MKTVLKFLTLGLILAAFSAISVISTNAQASVEECTPIYDNFKALRTSAEWAKLEEAVTVGKNYLEKCKDLKDNEAVYNYVSGQIPKLEAKAVLIKKDETIYQPYYKTIPAKDWANAFRLGKLVISDAPDDVDNPLVLASIGFDLSIATPPVDTYNADTVSMAKLALQKMEQGKASGSGLFGNFKGYTYKTDACPDGKTNATGWMNYIIGNVMFTRLNQKKESLPYFYKSTQVGCQTKDTIANIYRTVGNYYIDEFVRLEAEKNAAYDELIKLKTDDPGFADAEKKYKDLVALQKGYMERVMDAYARAYNAAVKNKETPAFNTVLLNRAKEFYGFRYKNDMSGFDAWLKALPSSLPDPTSAVTPVVETETTTAAPQAMKAADEAPSTSTAADTRARTVAEPAAKTTTVATTTAKKAPAKKTVSKKKP